jgi:hypothetical protein
MISIDMLVIDSRNSMTLRADSLCTKPSGTSHLAEAPIAALEERNSGGLFMDKDIDTFLNIVVFSLSTLIIYCCNTSTFQHQY